MIIIPVKRCQKNGKSGWKWGDEGKCYVGEGAKEKALAQGRAIKAREEDNMSKYLVKSQDEELRYTLGVAYPVKDVDTDGHFANAPALRKSAWDYLKSMQEDDDVEKIAKSIFEEILKAVDNGDELRIDITDMDVGGLKKNLKDMHMVEADGSYVVESYIAPADMDIAGEEIHKGDWLLGVVWSEEMFNKIKSGERTGYSIGGTGVLIDVEDVE